jgi:hypothetical protein
MPLSLQIHALYAEEIIREFQEYGLNVIAQEYRTGTYSGAAAREFHKRHDLDNAVAFIWVSEPWFANMVNTDRLAGRDMDISFLSGWIYFPGSSEVRDAGPIGPMIAERLRSGKAVTLTALTARHLNASFKAAPPVYCTWPLRMALWTQIRYALWTNRALMIQLRHRDRAQIWHLLCKSVAAYFARRPGA